MTNDPASSEPTHPPPWATRWVRRCLIELGYLFFLLVLLEVSLRLAGFLWLLPRTLTDATREEAAGEYRILAIGESTTFGLGVRPDEAYPALLEEMLNDRIGQPVRVVNVGVPGQTSTSILRSIRHQLDIHRPNLVLALYGINDANEALNDLSSRIVFGVHVPEWVADLRLYRLACIVRDYALYAPKREEHGAWTFFDRNQTTEEGGWIDNPFYLPQFKMNAAEIIATVRETGAAYVQVSYLRANAPLRTTLAEIVEEHGVPFIDLALTDETEGEWFTEDGFHPNAAGHRLMADRILEGLGQFRGILPESSE